MAAHDDGEPVGLGLADAIGQVRAELELAIEQGANSAVAFPYRELGPTWLSEPQGCAALGFLHCLGSDPLANSGDRPQARRGWGCGRRSRMA